MNVSDNKKGRKKKLTTFLLLAAASAFWSGFLDLVANGDVSAVEKLASVMHVHLGSPDYAGIGLIVLIIGGLLLCILKKARNRAESISIGLAAFVALNINPYQDPNKPSNNAVLNNDPQITITFEYPSYMNRVPDYLTVKLSDANTRRTMSKQYVSSSRELHLDLNPGDYRLDLEATGIRSVFTMLSVSDADTHYTFSLAGSPVPANIQKLYGPTETQLRPRP